MIKKPVIKIIHTLPNRVRIKLSEPLKNNPLFCKIVREKTKFTQIRYNNLINTVVISFDPSEILLQEVIYRTCIGYSIENGMIPIKLVEEKSGSSINQLSLYSGGMIALSSIYNLFSKTKLTETSNLLKATMGLTTLSVAEHAYVDTKRKGIFDLELLSVFYIMRNYVNAPNLSSLALMWLTTFGRHLVVNYQDVKEVKLLRVKGVDGKKDYYVANIKDSKEITNISEGIHQLLNKGNGKNAREEKYVLTI